jgi:hypothetical protein
MPGYLGSTVVEMAAVLEDRLVTGPAFVAIPAGRRLADVLAPVWRRNWLIDAAVVALVAVPWALLGLVLSVRWLVRHVRPTTNEVVAAVVLGLPAAALARLHSHTGSGVGFVESMHRLGHFVVVGVVLWLFARLVASQPPGVTGGRADDDIAAGRSAASKTGKLPCGCKHVRVAGRSAASTRRFIARHEAGHMAGGKYMSGGGGVSAEIFGYAGGGATLTHGHLDALGRLVTARAGRRAVGSNRGASWDMNFERQVLHPLRGRDRSALSREADRLVPKALSRYSGARRRWARILDQKGRVAA